MTKLSVEVRDQDIIISSAASAAASPASRSRSFPIYS